MASNIQNIQKEPRRRTFRALQLAAGKMRSARFAQSFLMDLQTQRNRPLLPGGRSQPAIHVSPSSSSSPPRHNSSTEQAQDSGGGSSKTSYRYGRDSGSVLGHPRTCTHDHITPKSEESHVCSTHLIDLVLRNCQWFWLRRFFLLRRTLEHTTDLNWAENSLYFDYQCVGGFMKSALNLILVL